VSLGTGLSDLRRSVAMSSSRVVRRALGPIVILSAFLGLAAAPPPALATGALCNTPSATPLCAAADPLPVFNSQHYTVAAGATITSTIVGATDLTGSETCTGGGAGVDVFIKGAFAGNEVVCGTLSACPGPDCTITFSYTAPNGPDVCVCKTSIVAYKTSGNNSTNDIIADGVFNGTPTGPAGFGFVDAGGQPIDMCGCPTTTTTSTTTSSTSTSSTTTSTTTTTTSTTTSTTTTSTTTTTTSTTTSTTTTSTTTTTTSTTTSTTTTSTTTTTTS